MKLHNEDIFVGDTVYDILEGTGAVASVDNNRITVKFGSRTYSYNSEGSRTAGTANRFNPFLYWHDPIVMIPTKSETKWEGMKQIFKNAHKTIKGM